MSTLYFRDRENVNLEDVVFEASVAGQVEQFLKEHRFSEILHQYELPVANKIFLYGKTGCGKTMTAKAIAKELDKKIFIVNLSTIVSSKLGETAKNINNIFKEANYENSVLFFDEFDSLGQVRDYDNKDSSEMKRVVNALLQLIDNFPRNAILIAATNQIQMIDEALLRRFELKLEFISPSEQVLDGYYDKLLARYPVKYQHVERKYGISFSEAKDFVFRQVKNNIILDEMAKLS
ncbi:AAA family ATPase [Flavobacterium lindanitolerans]|uniref:ATPase family protein associated with various cellular activities (AAA) n=1 Tax=Flavobacterium lindanitolerans TaxID=428988 RepID=A0A497VAP7_9FLAO|nr:ATP-binding protein [Flavobacterium lindanitolerans]MBC8643241.1 AAA family ATPase [Flavobacterium lindanitolerans]PKW29220.1 ATPase family protein associated with various cellular activities (AAA) [Flavobacterium lindanitolerans]RLJ35279.1 ATPase family protein associated with various cellular activities (AAA) [Flavobacterium lindanitolerans]